MPSAQIATPVPSTPKSRGLHLLTSQDLFASLNATLSSKDRALDFADFSIQDKDYQVPAPPPPSPVSFRHSIDQWPVTSRR